MQYLVFPRVLQGTDECPVATHGVTTDGHPVWVAGEVSVDQFGELREREYYQLKIISKGEFVFWVSR